MFKRWVVNRRYPLLLALLVAAAAGVALVGSSFGGSTNRSRPLPIGFTEGFGNEKVLAFAYPQQFFCTDERLDDLDGPGHRGDGRVAAVDPDEFQDPGIGPPGSPCIVGESGSGSLPQIDPTGRPISNVLKVWALLPFFDSEDPDAFIDAFDPTPEDGVDVQCPEPGVPNTQHHGTFSTCTMHPSTLHAEPVVGSLLRGLVCGMNAEVPGCPTGTAPGGDIPIPNHSHIIDGDSFNPVWWQTIAIRVFDRSIWPDFDGRCPANPAGGRPCLTSLRALRDAQARPFAANPLGTGTQAGPDTASNVFLFFDSQQEQN